MRQLDLLSALSLLLVLSALGLLGCDEETPSDPDTGPVVTADAGFDAGSAGADAGGGGMMDAGGAMPDAGLDAGGPVLQSFLTIVPASGVTVRTAAAVDLDGEPLAFDHLATFDVGGDSAVELLGIAGGEIYSLVDFADNRRRADFELVGVLPGVESIDEVFVGSFARVGSDSLWIVQGTDARPISFPELTLGAAVPLLFSDASPFVPQSITGFRLSIAPGGLLALNPDDSTLYFYNDRGEVGFIPVAQRGSDIQPVECGSGNPVDARFLMSATVQGSDVADFRNRTLLAIAPDGIHVHLETSPDLCFGPTQNIENSQRLPIDPIGGVGFDAFGDDLIDPVFLVNEEIMR